MWQTLLIIATGFFVSSPRVEWRMCASTATKEIMKKRVGYFPSQLESNCKYAIAFVDAYPVALFPFRFTSISGAPIAMSFYGNEAAIKYHGVRKTMWKDYYEQFNKTLPLLPNAYKRWA